MKYHEELKYFLKKPCTITVRDINWHYKVENMMDYFVGIVTSINDTHVWLRSLQNDVKNCIAMEHVIAIAEEPVLYENNPEDKKIIEEYKKEKPAVASKTTMPEFLDINKLKNIIKKP